MYKNGSSLFYLGGKMDDAIKRGNPGELTSITLALILYGLSSLAFKPFPQP
jgi:hypothetical protein